MAGALPLPTPTDRSFTRWKPLGGATLRITAVAGLLTLTIVGIPFAFVYVIRRSVTTQAIIVETSTKEALDRSADSSATTRRGRSRQS